MKLSPRKRLLWVWVAASVIWATVVSINYRREVSHYVYSISFYTGYYWETYRGAKSLGDAIADDRRTRRLSQICKEARSQACKWEWEGKPGRLFSGDARGRFVCDESKYRDNSRRMLREASFPSDDPKACDSFLGMFWPDVPWGYISEVLAFAFVPPLVVLLAWFPAKRVVWRMRTILSAGRPMKLALLSAKLVGLAVAVVILTALGAGILEGLFGRGVDILISTWRWSLLAAGIGVGYWVVRGHDAS